MAIYNGFALPTPDPHLLLCVLYLQKSEEKSLLTFMGVNMVAFDNMAQLIQPTERILKLDWEAQKSDVSYSAPDFTSGSMKNVSQFLKAVLQKVQENPQTYRFYTITTPYKKHNTYAKNEQSFKAVTISKIVRTLKTLIERQQNDEVRALYGSEPYHLSQSYKRFQVDLVRWHSMNATKKMKHVPSFRQYVPSLNEHFLKPGTSG